MGPRDWIETIKDAVKKIGDTGDTGGSQTEGTVFAKENAILEAINRFVNEEGNGVSIIKSIQHVIVYLNDTTVKNISISPVDASRCLVVSERLYDPYDYEGKVIYRLEDDKIVISEHDGHSTYKIYMGFWIVEFF